MFRTILSVQHKPSTIKYIITPFENRRTKHQPINSQQQRGAGKVAHLSDVSLMVGT